MFAFLRIALGFVLLVLAVGCRSGGGHPPPAPTGYNWEIVEALSDEFNHENLDPSKWQPLLPYWKGRPPSQFAPDNVSIENGLLLLRSTSRVSNLSVVKNPQKDIWVNAACVSSLRLIAGPGYYAARIRASSLPMTSSFWLQGYYSEIDVAEQRGAPIKHQNEAREMHSTIHYYVAGTPRTRLTRFAKTPLTTRADERFYVYSVWWKNEQTICFYLDGRKFSELTTPAGFHEPMYLIFDTEVWADHSGLPSIEALANPRLNTMQVDWVRAWRLVEKRAKL